LTSEIAYDELTYPEIAALPRDIPLVIPLGEGYTAERIGRAVRREFGRKIKSFVLLPAFPDAWVQSVRPSTLRRVVSSLHASLKAQGFTRISNFKFQISNLRQPARKILNLESEILNRVVLIATGHTEQHGYHLPVNTDTLMIDAIARGVEAALPGQVWRVPTLPYGVSMRRNQFPGTVTVQPRAWEDFVLQLVGAYVACGFDKFYIINGHGGNHSFLVNVIKYAGDRWPDIFCATSFLHLTGPGYKVVEQLRDSTCMGHACELETSFVLHLRPDLVHMERAVDETGFISTPEYTMDWLESGALIANPPWTDDTRTGAYGQPSAATAEKGAVWLHAAIDEKVEHVREIVAQQSRRLARRAEWWGGRVGRWTP
jgi:creatinine amidohydrolase